jgi:hypothetical protein
MCLPYTEARLPGLHAGVDELNQTLQINRRLVRVATPKRAALFVSRDKHCLVDLLWGSPPPGPRARRHGLRRPLRPHPGVA